jgi:hypothetical protein
MRSQSQIRHQLKQVAFRHLQKRLRALFKQRPDSCLHNYEAVLDLDNGNNVRLCGYLNGEGIPRAVPCDDRIPGCTEMARECPLWAPIRTKDEVKAAFREILESDDRGVVAEHFPDIAALMWVLDDPKSIGSDLVLDLSDSDFSNAAAVIAAVNGVPVPEAPAKPSWWRRLRHKLGGGG